MILKIFIFSLWKLYILALTGIVSLCFCKSQMPLSIPSDFPVWIQFLSWRGSPSEITIFLSLKNVQRIDHLCFFVYHSILTFQRSSSLCNYCTLTFSSANIAKYINTWLHHTGNHLLLQQLLIFTKQKLILSFHVWNYSHRRFSKFLNRL